MTMALLDIESDPNRDAAAPAAPAGPMKRFRLLVRAEIDGRLREPGYITTKPADWIGPHRTRVQQHEVVHVGDDSTRIPLTGVDEPLYEEVIEKPLAIGHAPSVADHAPGVGHIPSIADAHPPLAPAPSADLAAAQQRIADLEAELAALRAPADPKPGED
jgi:hypothetical protein